MGTLFNQPVRKWADVGEKELTAYIEELGRVAKKTKLPLDQVIKIAEIKQLERSNDLYVINGDIHDEQMSGIGELLDKINTSIEGLAKEE